MSSHLDHTRRSAPPPRAARRSAAIAAALLAAASLVARGEAPGVAGASPPTGPVATVESVLVQPDQDGVRVAIAVSGPFHYLLVRRTDRLEILLDPVSAAAANHTLAIGPVRSLRVRSIAGAPPRAEITVFTKEPVEAADSFLDGRTLAVRLVPALGRASAGARPKPAAPPAESRPQIDHEGRTISPTQQAEHVAGRAALERTLTLDEGTGRLIDVNHLARVAVSEPRVVGVVPVSGRELLVTARAPGRATVYVWAADGLVAYAVEVRAGDDPFRDLRRALAALLPDASITVTEIHGTPSPAATPLPPGLPDSTPPPAAPRAGDPPAWMTSWPASPPPGGPPAPPAVPPGARGVVLSGSVETQMDRAQAEQVARAFVSGVVNLLVVRRPVQFSLQVEVVELTRNAQEALGITWGGGQQAPGSPPSLNGGVYNFQILTSPGLSATGLDLLIAQIEALSQRGQARLLARPGLVVLAGRTASLLLGGQVPVPVAGENGTVTIEYKDFGVILTARPEYQSDGRVFLQITPEVSTLDFTDAIKVAGFAIPALRVRRAQTMVAMRPGETLVLGGLLQREDVELVQKLPLLGDLPIIGALFRSRSFQRQESDLMILVTPRIVESPAAPPAPPAPSTQPTPPSSPSPPTP
jgi:Flp pilus assembly secretin CpaC